MPAIATYPGTVTPLRGLNAFAESERDVLFGRDRERDELSRLVTSEGFRAGLLYGEPGVGKTSLLRAGLVPDLRDHGVVALVCQDIYYPVDAFAHALTEATGLAPSEGEQPITFLSRVVSQSLEGQLYLFILDEVDRVLEVADERIIGELGDLFARVVTRSGGRARFLFCCASESVHLFGLLEKRTGSLFPPSSRYLLERFAPADAAMVLDRTLALAGVAADQQLAGSVVETLARDGAILPADVQIAALAIRELGLTSPAHVGKIGGATELERLWITGVAASTGNENLALRLVAELATPRGGAFAPEWAATRAGIDPTVAPAAFATMAERGLVRAVASPDGTEPHYELAHPILARRVREVAAVARASARRAFELLGSKAAEGKRLSLGEWRALKREKITPSTPEEMAVVRRTKRFFTVVAGVVAALPIVILIVIWVSISGTYYLDVDRAGGGPERVVVRSGNPSLSGFFWLPGSPSYGSIVADTGFTRAMIDDESWDRIAGESVTGDLDGGGFVDDAMEALDPQVRYLIVYASTRDAKALEQLKAAAKSPEETVAMLEALEPIADGSSREVDFVRSLLQDGSSAVRNAALAVAQAATRRGADAYHEVLAQQLASDDPEQRRLAFSTVQALPADTGKTLYALALEQDPSATARRELLAQVTAGATRSTPSAETAKSVLVNRDIGDATRQKARELLRRAFRTSPDAASQAAAELAADAKAPKEDRVLALDLLYDHAPEDSYQTILPDVKQARRAKEEAIRAAALPLHAKLAPKDASGDLALMLDDEKRSEAMTVAMTLAWGEVAKTGDKAAQGALESLLESNDWDIKAAAARAYGSVGRRAQTDLIKMIKKEPLPIAVGAAYGLANSAEQNGSTSRAVGGIYQLWKKKGVRRRHAAEVYARMARNKSAARRVYSYLSASARSDDDPRLHTIGIEGLCNAMTTGYGRAERDLRRAHDHDSIEVRRLVINCVSDHPGNKSLAVQIATRMADDPSVDIRIEAARVLARLAAGDKPPKAVGEALTEMIGDDSRDVRVLALRALADMGTNAPENAAKAIIEQFDAADAGERLELLEAARAIGAADVINVAIGDPSPAVRIAAIDTAISTGTQVASSLNAALTDDDRAVRRAALERLATEKDKLDQEQIDRALALAVHDPDPSIGRVALATVARIGRLDAVEPSFAKSLASRSERERTRVAAASIGLVERGAPKKAIELLEPLVDDPSHDVRAAALEPLAAAYAATNSPEQLAELLRGAEKHAMRRMVAAAAFVALARTEAGRAAAKRALEEVAEDASPMVEMSAELALGLVESKTDGIAFLRRLVP